jgi:Ca-activated chloride channel family protein
MTSFNLFISNFHFVRPYWLLALFALFLVLGVLKKYRFYQSPWQQFLPDHLSQILVEGNSNTASNKKTLSKQAFLLKPFLIGLLSIIALAGPVWKKLPQPVYQTERGSVLIMDMSYSMYATDVKPNRLTRSRFKAIDLLNKINEGDTGLIAYAGDAFIISPLTQDIKNIALLLPSLTPEIMPTPGANPIAALTLAHDMLINAGHLNGDIYWFTDDIDNDEISDIYDWSNKFGHQLNILGVGSESGAPITLPSGELLKDNTGSIVVPRLPSQKLQGLALRGNGHYQTIKNDDSDINNLILKDNISEKSKSDKQESQQTGDQWQEQGAWLLILVLPLMLSYFRRGSSVLMLPLSCLPLLFLLSFSLISPTSFAADEVKKTEVQNSLQESLSTDSSTMASTSKKLWRNLWKTNDQQAQAQYNEKNYKEAAELFDNYQWQGSAHYKAGNYQAALDAYKQGEEANTANSLYNQGNALAQLQELEKSIESYKKALEINPNLQDAKDNIEAIKELQKKQKEQEQKNEGEKSENDDSQDEESQENKNQQDSQSENEQSENDQSQDSENKDNQQNSDDEQQSQDSKNNDKDNKQEESNQENSEESAKEQQEKDQQQKEQKQTSAEKSDEQSKQDEKKTAAQIAAEQQEKEIDQKHQQLLNKVTDDPYLLLRNKMQIEYQKRKQNGATRGVKKQW